jgi:hypothetical protein
MKFFWQKRAADDFMDAIRPELRAIPTPRPSDALKQRILASRSAGARVILPDVPQPARRSTRAMIGIAVAAALVVTLIPFQLRRVDPDADDAFASSGFLGPLALSHVARAELPELARAERGTLREVSVVFARSMRDSTGRSVGTSTSTLVTRSDSLDGVRAWRIVYALNQVGPASPWRRTETTYVAAANSVPLQRAIHTAPYSRYRQINVYQRFRGDSVSGHMDTDGPSIGKGRDFDRRLAPARAPYVFESVAPLFLMGVPLERGWRRGASLLGWAVRDDDVSVPIELVVEGDEVVTVPAGRFDCWRLSLRLGDRTLAYWARKSDGLGVRVLDARDPRTGGVTETVLAETR